ncbi:unnamed protein product [Notodromas monacha]|uniref:Uncharacterized protein n=1 Tax=Notodromas monacha TaxID=399045 RepID=A0A7R9BFL7_9CRUS|nr:unnamed protein product [Notodromas monacha]CAG0912942.1 unnamed protein product [Notodromas monacha]
MDTREKLGAHEGEKKKNSAVVPSHSPAWQRGKAAPRSSVASPAAGTPDRVDSHEPVLAIAKSLFHRGQRQSPNDFRLNSLEKRMPAERDPSNGRKSKDTGELRKTLNGVDFV